MKKIFLFALFIAFSVNAFSQESKVGKVKSFLKQFEYTISAGFGTTASSDPYDLAIVNINAGVDVKKNILSFSDNKGRLYGLVGLHFTQRGGKMSSNLDDMMSSGNSFREVQFNIPIHVGYKYVFKNDTRLFVDLGPYIGVNGNCSLSEGYGECDYELKSKPLDFGIGGNIGVCFKKFGLGIGFDKGFLDIAELSSEEMGISKKLKSAVSYIRLQWTFGKQ
ncbi:MAG: outer membrane beta-barrel protein [Candidatus Limisoma sp.]